MRLNRKVVLVTGGSRGLGSSIVKKFARLNYDVIINYKESSEIAELLGEEVKKKYGVDFITIKADISSESDVKNMVELSIEKFGKIDVLVNNAGIAIDTLYEDKNVENFKKILNVNLIGTFLVSKYVSKYMLENKSGNIINISSTNGIDTYYPYSMDYDASKAGIISLTHNLARQLSPYINVNCVAPGWIKTDMNKDMDKEFMADECKKIFLGRFAETDEIANVVSFLASSEASYVNGSIIRVDGGH